ncbi:MAG: HAMP domain-containing histidine kinase [Peptococcaceae bacterium]|nr:HAMP domain-containing histidine kinase [Peptococcaceae bacterium]
MKMKMWQKICVLCIGILLISMIVCGMLFWFLLHQGFAGTQDNGGLGVLIWPIVLSCGISILAGILLTLGFVRRVFRPLRVLRTVTSRLAAGEYAAGELPAEKYAAGDYKGQEQIYSHDEVGELAADINVIANTLVSCLAELEETNRRQAMFIRGLMHELKTPLTTIMVHTDTLLVANLSQSDARNSLAHIYMQCSWLNQMSQKLHKIIKTEEGIQTRPENVHVLFEDIVESTAEILQERRTPLEAACEMDFLSMDYDLMKSLLINLVDNASKASEPGQKLHLRAYDNILELRDDGHGIPAHEIALVTDPFYMVDSSRNKLKGGSGLGLALVKRIAEAHNAQVLIESTPNSGTTVRVVFRDSSTP